MADWARLLSECWGLTSAAGSNPALPAMKKRAPKIWARFAFSFASPLMGESSNTALPSSINIHKL